MNKVTKDHIGKRVLLNSRYSSSVEEHKILELSPSEEYFKSKNSSDRVGWYNVENYKLKEVLEDKISGNFLEDNLEELKKQFTKFKEKENDKVPIYAGCPNAGRPCFCTGQCQKIIGWRDTQPWEKNPHLGNTDFGFNKGDF